MDTGVSMANFMPMPDEIEFLTNYSNAESKEAKEKFDVEYKAQMKAYLDWMDNVNKDKKQNSLKNDV